MVKPLQSLLTLLKTLIVKKGLDIVLYGISTTHDFQLFPQQFSSLLSAYIFNVLNVLLVEGEKRGEKYLQALIFFFPKLGFVIGSWKEQKAEYGAELD